MNKWAAVFRSPNPAGLSMLKLERGEVETGRTQADIVDLSEPVGEHHEVIAKLGTWRQRSACCSAIIRVQDILHPCTPGCSGHGHAIN